MHSSSKFGKFLLVYSCILVFALVYTEIKDFTLYYVSIRVSYTFKTIFSAI